MTDDTSTQHRGRRWRRIRLVILAGLLLMLAVYVALDWQGGRQLDAAIARFEQRFGPLTASIAAADVPANDNRAKVVKAAVALVAPPSSTVQSAISRLSATNPPSEIAEQLQAFIDANAASLRLASDIKTRHQSSWDIDYAGPDATGQLPLHDTRTLGDALYVSARLDLEKGRLDDAAERAVDALAVAASLRQEPILIGQLVRISIGTQPLDVIQRLLATSEPSRVALDSLATWVAENLAQDGIRIALFGEVRVMNLRFEETESGTSLGLTSRLRRPFVRMMRARYLDDLSQILDVQSGPRPRPASPPRPTPRWWSPIDQLVGSFLPGLDRTLGAGDDFATQLAAAQLSLALHRYRLDRGGYPDDLSALVPAYVARLPLDMSTGKPPAYSHQGNAFTIRASLGEMYSPRRPLLEWTSTGAVRR